MFKKAALKMSKLRTCFFTSLLLTVKLEKEAGNHFFFFTFVQEMLHPQQEYETSALKERGQKEKNQKQTNIGSKHRVLIDERITNRNNATKILDCEVCGDDNCNVCSQNEHMQLWMTFHSQWKQLPLTHFSLRVATEPFHIYGCMSQWGIRYCFVDYGPPMHNIAWFALHW